jgi:hypothetical protein
MAPFGVKTSLAEVPARFEPGARVGPMRVLARTEHEILLGEDDKHLDFRVSFALGDRTVTVATAVRFHGWTGRAYFAPVRPLHARIVRAMLARAVFRE